MLILAIDTHFKNIYSWTFSKLRTCPPARVCVASIMLSFTCGNSAASSTPTASEPIALSSSIKRLAYESILEKQAAISELQRPPEAQLERAMRNYESLAAQVRPLNQTNSLEMQTPSTLMEIIRTPASHTQNSAKNRSHALSYVDIDEIELTDMYEGLCRVFCQPNLWSPAFASPGDFTIKMASVFLDRSVISFRIAVMCCCARSVCDGSRVKPASKRQYYVSYVERTQLEIVQLTEVLSLQYLGHRLTHKMPMHGNRLITTPKQQALNEYGDKVIQFLSYVMQITEIGFNRLVKAKEPVSSNVRVRDFLGLSLTIGEHTIVATSSCDARIESQDDTRPVLPSAWFDNDANLSVDTTFGGYAEQSPRDDITLSRTFNHTFDHWGDFGQVLRPTNTHDRLGAGKCVRFIDPVYWSGEPPSASSFTVEISSVTVMDGIAKFAISVLFYTNGELEVANVDRRYSEFDDLAIVLEEKVPILQIRSLLPPKTFFRYTSASFLERRAAFLQYFLERLLRMSFQGILDQTIPLTAEPCVRDFLKLPRVEWIVVPWSKQPRTPKMTRDGIRTHSTTAVSEFSPRYNACSSPRRNPRYISNDISTPRYESLMIKRSDSM